MTKPAAKTPYGRLRQGAAWRIFAPIPLLACLLGANMPAVAAKQPLHINASKATITENEHFILTGNVAVSGDDFSASGEQLDLNLKDNTAQFVGAVTLTLKDQSLKGDDLWLNLDTREWRFRNARTEIQPAFFGKGVAAPIYLFGEDVQGSPTEIHLTHGGFTTCDLPHPHYSMQAGDVLIIVGDNLTAHKASLWVGQSRLLTFPSFSMPLKPIRRPPYLPQMGRNSLEGFFANTSYNYVATKDTTGSLILNFTQRQGTSTALDHKYSLPLASGELYLLRQWDKNAVNGRFRHHQTLGSALELDSSADYVRNTFYSTAASTTTNTNDTISYHGRNANSSLSLTTSRTEGNFTNTTLSSVLRHSQNIGPRVSADLTANLTNYSVPGGFWDKELQSNLALSGRAPNFDWRLTEQKRNDLDGDSYTGDNNYSYMEKLPELVLQTSTDKLPWNLLGRARGDMSMTLSRATERRSGRDLSRGSFDFRSSQVKIPFSPTSTLNVTSGFRQSFYQGGSAQYALQNDATWHSQLGGKWNSDLRYVYREAAGFSPFDFDTVPSQSSLDLNISLDKPSARVTLSSGYDLRRAVYRDALLRANFQFSTQTSLSLSTAYSVQNSTFRPLQASYSRRGKPGDFSFDSSLRYDVEAGKLGSLLGRLNWPISSQWRLESISGYNGILKRMNYNDLRLTKDLHCFLATLTYSQQKKELRFNIMIKAFPILDRYFGVSPYGQQLGTGLGELY